MTPDDLAVRAATTARTAAAQNPAPYWVVSAVPANGQPWINVVQAFGREDDARARLAQLSIAPRVLAAVYASDGAGHLTLLDLWGPGYAAYQPRTDDTRGRYGTAVVGTSAPGEKTGWGTWAAIGAAAIGGYFVLRAASRAMKSQGGQNAFWDTFPARHGYDLPTRYRK